MKKIEAKIVADSIDPRGNRITSYILTYPRFIHSELMTHRMFSRNAASSRAIPFDKMVKMIEEDPFIPIAWQKDHKGMQGTEYLTGMDVEAYEYEWLSAKDSAIITAESLSKSKITKQLCNRLLEPFMWYTVLVTATEFDNFFELRCPKYKGRNNQIFKSKKDLIKDIVDNTEIFEPRSVNYYTTEEWLQLSESQAEIHIQALAESMWDARNESIPKELKAGEWHIPFGDKIEGTEISQNNITYHYTRFFDGNNTAIKIAVARAARISYTTHDGEINYEKDIKLHDQLLESRHMSPFEHCARAMNNEEYQTYIKGKCEVNPISEEVIAPVSNEGWCNNFRGFIPYRYLIENK